MKSPIVYKPNKPIGLIVLWVLVLSLIGLRAFEFYEGDDSCKNVNAVLWKLQKGQKKMLDHLKNRDSYDDEY